MSKPPHGTLHHIDRTSTARSLTRLATGDAGVHPLPKHRHRPGLNHVAFHSEDVATVEKLTGAAAQHGWHLMFPERHPHAGGDQHHAAYLENDDGFEVELVASNSSERQ